MEKNYRPNACAVVFNHMGKVLLCKRRYGVDQFSWQFPQGGIEPGESPAEAARRELAEETSVVSAVEVLSLPDPFCYDFPKDVIEKFIQQRGFSYDGQKQYWSLFYFTGEDTEINLNTAEPEFIAWEWADIKTAADRVWPVKREMYAEATAILAPKIASYLKNLD